MKKLSGEHFSSKLFCVTKNIVPLLFLSLWGCSVHHPKRKFLDKTPQKVHHRTVMGKLDPVDSLKLSTIGIYRPGWIRLNKTHLFISNNVGEYKIVVLDKHNLKEKEVDNLNIQKGKGPGEMVNFMDFDVRDSLLVLADENQRKMEFWKLPDTFLKEVVMPNPKVSPHRLQIINAKRYMLFSPTYSSGFLFNIVDGKGNRVSGFFKIPANYNKFAYEGEIRLVGNELYYAGFSEPILKKYTLKGRLEYSVSTIDNYNTAGNYATIQGGTQTVMRYAPGALFSTPDFDVSKKYWYVLPAANGDPKFTYLDIYDEENGDYLATFKLRHLAGMLQVDDHFIYTIEKEKDNYLLTVYKNNIVQKMHAYQTTDRK